MNNFKAFPVNYTPNLFAGFPVCFISVKNNICPLTMVQIVSYQPLTLGVGINPESKTHQIFSKANSCVLSFATIDMIEAVKKLGTVSGKEVDNKCNLIELESSEWRKHRVINNSPVRIFCSKKETKNFGDRTWFFLEIKDVHVKKGFDKGKLLYFSDGIFGKINKIEEF